MSTGGDQQRATRVSSPHLSEAPLRSAALAAGLLEEACAPGSGDPLRLEVVSALARDLAEELEALAVLNDCVTAAVEGSLRAADLANLAACIVPELSQTTAPQAAAAAHLATGAVRALGTLARAGVGDTHEEPHEEPHGEHEQNLSKDAWGAVWRAQLAVQQVNEFMEKG